jgi:hypothetical protein
MEENKERPMSPTGSEAPDKQFGSAKKVKK